MKKLFTLLVALIGFCGFKSIPKVALVFATVEMSAQNYVSYSDFTNHTYSIRRTSDNFDLFMLKNDTMRFRGKAIIMDSISMVATQPTGSMMWIGANRKLQATQFSSLTFPYAQLTGVPATKRVETYSGTTNASGNYTVTFASSYSVAPNVQANPIGGTALYKTITSVSTTGFTVNISTQNSAIVALVSVLLPGVTAVSGASVDILITEK